MRGDLCFYASSNSLLDRLVCWRTQPGPFVHCEIDLGDATAIGALASGVTHHALVVTPAQWRFSTAAYTTPAQLERGLTWLEQQIGDRYSLADILDYLVPRRMRFLLTERRAFDCSQLGADFLQEAGVVCCGADARPAGLATLDWTATETISPNALARACGIVSL